MHVMMLLLTNVHNSVYSPLVAVGWPCGVCTKGVGRMVAIHYSVLVARNGYIRNVVV